MMSDYDAELENILGRGDWQYTDKPHRLQQLIEQAHLHGFNECWGATYSFLHSNDRSLCKDWEEIIKELKQRQRLSRGGE